jgi:hypothetical protein
LDGLEAGEVEVGEHEARYALVGKGVGGVAADAGCGS